MFRQNIDHRNRSMMAYTETIEAGVNENKKQQNKQEPEDKYLRDLTIEDGLIYQFKCLSRKDPGNNLPPLGVKVLICVCMYNEGRQAIQMTLEGIYRNLKELKRQGIAAEEVGVVLVQDGILKLVKDRKTRELEKGTDSMVEFYRQLDRICNRKYCDLEQRIHTILDET